MIKKILLLATVAFSLLISGCEQPLPPADNPPQNPTPEVTKPKNPPETSNITQPEKPSEKPITPPAPEKTDANTEPPQVVKPAVQNKKISVKVYYPDDAGINLVGVKRSIEIKDDTDKYLAAVQLLMNQPSEKDLTVIFPKNAKINGVTFDKGTVTVDFDKNITKGFAGGSTGEELLINSIVKTLIEFKEVQQVRFLVDGQEIETLSGHMDLSVPIKRADL